MQTSVNIKLGVLRAAFLVAPKRDVRKYLVGVAIARGHVVATDGHRAFTVKQDGIDDFPECIIPYDTLKFFLQKVGRTVEADAVVSVGLDDTGGVLALNAGASAAVEYFQPVDDVYPPFERIMLNRTEAGPTGQHVWSDLVLFEKVAEALGRPKKLLRIYVLPDGYNATRVMFPGFPEANAVCMPLRPESLAEARADLGIED